MEKATFHLPSVWMGPMAAQCKVSTSIRKMTVAFAEVGMHEQKESSTAR